MKGQLSFIIKPITLVMIIALLLLLYQSISASISRGKKLGETLDLTASATNILLILANSSDCLAYEGSFSKSLYANVVDVNRLEEFSKKYAGMEPECARSYDFGWGVTITELKNTGEEIMEGKNWTFGAQQFSSLSSTRSVDYWMPVAIVYSEKIVKLGKMSIHLVDGELEKIAGVLDWDCAMGKRGKFTKSSVAIDITSPISYNSDKNSLCSGSKIRNCRKLDCEMTFKDLDKGKHVLTINYVDGKLVIK